MTPWCGATGAGLRRKRKIGSRSSTNLVVVEGPRGSREELEGEHLGSVESI